MPYGEPEPEDPQILVGVGLPGGRESMREMAIAFAEEYASLGFGEERLMALFKKPFYAGAHRAFKVLGEEEIGRVVRESVAAWGRCRVTVREPGRPGEQFDAARSRSGGRSAAGIPAGAVERGRGGCRRS